MDQLDDDFDEEAVDDESEEITTSELIIKLEQVGFIYLFF
jgi:hypothetical protein